MKRRLLNLLTALSLLLCVASVAVWVRSYLRTERLSYWGNAYVVGLHSGVGQVGLSVAVVERMTITPRGLGFRYASEPAASIVKGPIGFGWTSSQVNSRAWAGRLYIVGTPFWLLAMTTALLPAAWVRHRIKARRRRRLSLCRACGYDLRATPERCPECGHTPVGVTS